MKSRIQKKYYTNVLFSLFKYESIFKKNGITILYEEIEQSPISNSVYVWLYFKDMAYRVRVSDHELPLGGQMPSYTIDELILSTGSVQFPISKILLYKSKYEFYKNNFETAQQRYAQGLISSLANADADLKYRVAVFNQQQAVYNYVIAKFNFDKATGGFDAV